MIESVEDFAIGANSRVSRAIRQYKSEISSSNVYNEDMKIEKLKFTE